MLSPPDLADGPASRRRTRATRAVRAVAALVAVIGLGGVVAGPGAAPARADGGSEPAVVSVAGGVAVTGHGYGHGRGLSQYGARGAASSGLDAAAILAFYYPGTSAGSAADDASVRVRLDDRLAAGGLQASGTVAGALRMTDTGDGTTWTLDHDAAVRVVPVGGAAQMQVGSAATSWRTVRTLVGPLRLSVTSGAVALTADDASVRTYAGTVTTATSGTGATLRVWAVNTVGLEDYVRGVVPAEMPTSWPAAAVQAQAVAARTYALAQQAAVARTSAWDLCATSACQVYRGITARTSGGDAAVAATAGVIRTVASAPALTEFSSSDGGWTAAGPASRPYLSAQPDPYEAGSGNPNATWTTTVPLAAVAAAWPQVGQPRAVAVLSRDGHGADGGRLTQVQVRGSSGSVDVTGTAFASALGLKSSWVVLRSLDPPGEARVPGSRATKRGGRKAFAGVLPAAPTPTPTPTPPS